MFTKSPLFDGNKSLEYGNSGMLRFIRITPLLHESGTPEPLFRQRIGTKLEVHRHRLRAFSAFPQPWRTVAARGP
jgi:hypothetical protein